MARPITHSITAIGLLIDGFRRDKSECRIPVVSAPIAYIGVQEGSDFSELVTLRKHLEDIANFSVRKYAPTTLRFGRDNSDLFPDLHTEFYDNLGTGKHIGVLSDVPNKVPSLGQPFPSLEMALLRSNLTYHQVEETASKFRYG